MPPKQQRDHSTRQEKSSLDEQAATPTTLKKMPEKNVVQGPKGKISKEAKKAEKKKVQKPRFLPGLHNVDCHSLL